WLFSFQCFRTRIRTRLRKQRSRLLLRFSRIQKTAKRIYDAEHSEHRPCLRAAIKARRNIYRRTGEPLRATQAYQRARSGVGSKARLRVFRRREFPLDHADLREEQSRH